MCDYQIAMRVNWRALASAGCSTRRVDGQTFGKMWLEHVGHKNDDALTLSELREPLVATFEGRLYQNGNQVTASGYVIFSNGRKFKFGALNSWLDKLFQEETHYPPYTRVMDGVAKNAESIRVLGFASSNRRTSLPTTGTPGVSGATQTQVSYDDFTIDGVRVYEMLFARHDPDNVSSFDESWPEGAVNSANELLGERTSELDDGRVPLYVCPECADLGCGALTVEIERNDEYVRWKNFGWQSTLEEGWGVGDYTHLTDMGPFVFDRGQYDALLTDAREKYAALPTPERFRNQSKPSLLERLLRKFGS